jgi:hypothetical protein
MRPVQHPRRQGGAAYLSRASGPAKAGWSGGTGSGCWLKPRRKPVASQAVGRRRSQTTPRMAYHAVRSRLTRHERRDTKIDTIVFWS